MARSVRTIGRGRLYERTDPTVKVRLPSGLMTKLRQLATMNGRTIAGQVRFIVIQHLEQNGGEAA